MVANSSHKRTANRSGRHSHSQQAQSEPNRARDIGPRMLTSQPSAYLMTMELHRRRRASRGQSKPFDEMRLSTCRGARSTAAAQRQSAEGSRSTAGSSQRARPSNWRAESHHARMLQNRHRASSHKLGPECQISIFNRLQLQTGHRWGHATLGHKVGETLRTYQRPRGDVKRKRRFFDTFNGITVHTPPGHYL